MKIPRHRQWSQWTCAAVCLTLLAGFGAGGVAAQTAVTDQMLLRAADDPANWLTYGGNYANTRYTRSNKINLSNVTSLAPRWVFQTSGPIGSFETTPVVVDGMMYITTPFANVIAINARTGQKVWRYDHKQSAQPIICCGPNNRGVVVAYGKVFVATLDAHLVARELRGGAAPHR